MRFCQVHFKFPNELENCKRKVVNKEKAFVNQITNFLHLIIKSGYLNDTMENFSAS